MRYFEQIMTYLPAVLVLCLLPFQDLGEPSKNEVGVQVPVVESGEPPVIAMITEISAEEPEEAPDEVANGCTS